MLVSYNWLQELVDVKMPPQELADKITLAGVEIASCDYLGEGIENVITARIEKIEPHPAADKLIVTQVDTGSEKLQIVTGATNVHEGDIIPLAVHGAHLPGGIKIKRSKLRGVESCGMMCSAQELGMDAKDLPDDMQHGIFVLPADTPIGLDAKKVLGLDDYIIDFDITPNRGDCLSMIGAAREVAAVLNLPFKYPEIKLNSIVSGDKKPEIVIDEPDLCRRYVARMVKNVKIGPSPLWMQQRLRFAGVRPINTMVDITNYVLMEYGQPMHAFDYNIVNDGKIIVRRAKNGEKLVTLDDKERNLTEDMLLITDPRGPIALAGVMGGLDSEITESTTDVLLESAYFDPVNIRRTSSKLGLRSEASARFEKSIDINGCLRACNRACELIELLGCGEVTDIIVDNYINPIDEKSIEIDPERISRKLGAEITREQLINYYKALTFKVEEAGEKLKVTVPTCRPDISIEADLMEEAARLFGYDNIKPTLPYGPTTQGGHTPEQKFMRLVKSTLVDTGLNEVLTYSFISPKAFAKLNLPADNSLCNVLPIKNPLSEEHSVMRTTLLPGLLDVLSKNQSRHANNMAIFETGLVFTPRRNEDGGFTQPEERKKLAAAIIGCSGSSWNRPAATYDFYYLKGVVERLLQSAGVKEYKLIRDNSLGCFHPSRTAALIINGKQAGLLGEIHPRVKENYDLTARACICEIDLALLYEAATTDLRYQDIVVFPGSSRDLAMVVSEDIPVADIQQLIMETGGEYLKSVSLFDVYQGKQIEKGYRSLAFSLFYQAADRTLTDNEINESCQRIQSLLADKLKATLRG